MKKSQKQPKRVVLTNPKIMFSYSPNLSRSLAIVKRIFSAAKKRLADSAAS